MLHFSAQEFETRMRRLEASMQDANLDGMLIFAPESQYWLTGHDTFGFCFFQCLILGGREPVLLTRSADRLQAQMTSTIRDIRIWRDGADADPAAELVQIVRDLGLDGKVLGWETDTHGLTGAAYGAVIRAMDGVTTLVDASALVSGLRLSKSESELSYIRRAALLGDTAFESALPLVKPGAQEGQILAAMQGAILAEGGDYPANNFVIGSSNHAVLCRYASGRRALSQSDQLTLEWSGVYRHYHAPLMRTLVVGRASDLHKRMFEAAATTLKRCEASLIPGTTMGAVYDVYAASLDEMDFGRGRLNACGYAVGARFAPSWMEREMFRAGETTRIGRGMSFFLHVVLTDDDSGTAMTVGRTSVVTDQGAEILSRHKLELVETG